MTLKDDDVLRSFAGNARCETCGTYGPVCGHHYWIRRGCGGGTRIDHPWNLIALCMTCHAKDEIPDRRAFQKHCLRIVAEREHIDEHTIREYLWWLGRQDRNRLIGRQS